MSVPSKRNKIPTIRGIHLESRTLIELMKRPDEDEIAIGAALGQDESRWIQTLTGQRNGTLIIPVASPPNDYTISRFIAKVGLESLAFHCIQVEGKLDEVVDKPELDELRSYVRIGTPGKVWPYSCRSIYPPNFLFTERMSEK